MYTFDLNADLYAVWLRLAGNFKAGMAEEAMHHSRNVDYSCSTQDARSIFEEDDRESE